MSPETSKSHKIRRIVRLRQMLQHWRKKARAAACTAPPSDVPAGHIAVCVGTGCRRFIVRTTFLNHPIFLKLLSQAEEEYGFETRGPLALPCDESVFEEVLRVVAHSELSNSSRTSNLKDLTRRCDEDVRSKNLEFLGESRPLLYGFSDNKSVC
ncbi:auxin-induced protein X10A [Cucumis sativus]|nr:auxin-induced protein X10A [Cucumis sativus]